MVMVNERAPALLPLLLLLLFLLSTADLTSSQISISPSQISPSQAPEWPVHISLAPSPSPAVPCAPTPAPSLRTSLPPRSVPSSAPSPPPTTPPAPVLPDDELRAGAIDAEEAVWADETGGVGPRGSNKAGIAVGVIASAALAWMAVAVYRKRRQNLRRARYGFATRSDIL